MSLKETFKKNAMVLALAGVMMAATSPTIVRACGGGFISDAIAPLMNTFLQNQLSSVIPQLFTKGLNSLGSSITNTTNQAVSVAGQSIQAEINKGAIAEVNTQTAIAAYQTQQQMQWRANDASAKLEQPANTCDSVQMANNLGTVATTTRAAASAVANRSVAAVAYSGDPAQNITRSYANTMQTFCSDADQALGRCGSPAPKEVQNADIRGSLLFGDGSQGLSRSQEQKNRNVTGAFIDRVTGAEMAPPLLQDPNAEKTIQGRVYVELQRRFASIQSLVSHSLSSIAANHETVQGQDKSPAEMIDAYIQQKFSSSTIKDLATATDSNKILREMATTSSFNLWISFQQMQQTERIEALTAAQLSLMAEQQLKPQLESQRAAAVKAAGR